MFSEKLNFLMCVTNSKNSSLAAAANIDASLISRLRRGDRSLPKGQNYLNNIAKYLARRITGDFQKKIVCRTFCIDEIPHGEDEFAALIVKWLTDPDMPRETRRTE